MNRDGHDRFANVGRFLHRYDVHPRRWLLGRQSYSRFLGYVKPHLLDIPPQEYRIRRHLLALGWEARQLKAPIGKRIVAVSPHPDDETIGAGGLLLAHGDIADIHLICLTDGESGGALESGLITPVDIAKERQAEAQLAAQKIHAKSVQFCHWPDGDLKCTHEMVTQLRSLVTKLKPDVVTLPWFLDGHPDHRMANLLYATACSMLDCVVLAYEIWTLLDPNAIFDITERLEQKLDLIGCYKSQLRTVDYLNYAQGLARIRAYHSPINLKRSGAVEAYIALPNRDYCDLVLTLSNESTIR